MEATLLKNCKYKSDFARTHYSEGWRKGWQEGLQEGRKERLVRELLVEKFGPLEPDIDARLSSASGEELSEIAKRVLRATSLDAVFRRS